MYGPRPSAYFLNLLPSMAMIDLANLLISTGMSNPRLSGDLRMATVLFTDLVGFTRLSEFVDPVELIGILNEYFDIVSKIIRKHDGLVLNYIGDSVYAVFNVPKEDPDHAENAIRCALELDATLKSTSFANGVFLPTRIGVSKWTCRCRPCWYRSSPGILCLW
ncbi:adenylate/guanylate cyclase domain-containing protein [Sneathiella marina]|uniref:Adenylate/guanylate cyclase domain-containing protein n=1 Tax=Sneathiella marina TaxID=2950108 RepID=A0ABY4WAA2_9PROT|nr:adenylate/guanylate cyclase domain-containing protein [Sneathiella marina]USG62209.1 adenylate/guanylate cyclase domain-containing protein [Sneathiella marina]